MSRIASGSDRPKAAHEKSQEAIQSIVTGEDWRKMLTTAAKFHRYPFQSQLLIFLQRADFGLRSSSSFAIQRGQALGA